MKRSETERQDMDRKLQDKKLQLVRKLYDPEGGEAPSDLSPEETREEQLMGEAKFVLDRRERLVPDAAVIDAIVARAAEAVPKSHAKIIPIWSMQRLQSWRPAIAAAFAIVVVGAAYLGYTRSGGDLVTEPSVAETEALPRAEEASTAAFADNEDEAGLDAARKAVAPTPADLATGGRRDANVGLSRSNEIAAAGSIQPELMEAAFADSLPAWEDPADIRLLQKRIEMLRQSGDDLDWGAPAVPLESLPATATRPGIRAASTGNNNNR